MKRKCNAYMTVEACMVMPVVMSVYLFLIQYAVWTYDRCMLEFDVATVLLRSSVSAEVQSTYQRERMLWDKEKYLWFHSQKMQLEKGVFMLKVAGHAEGEPMGTVDIYYEMRHIEPEQWLRVKRKLSQDSNNGESEEK